MISIITSASTSTFFKPSEKLSSSPEHSSKVLKHDPIPGLSNIHFFYIFGPKRQAKVSSVPSWKRFELLSLIFLGFLLPLCEGGDCTLREAIIIGSVLARNSIPLLHSCAVMLKIAEMEYSGANSIFLRIFFDKKYALPYRVVDSVVFHFIRFRSEKRELPVLWHQALLTFVQRYI